MPIVVNGTGTVTGISVGGLPDGIVDTDMLAANAVTAAKASGSVKGITMMDQWRLANNVAVSANTTVGIYSNWERNDNNFTQIGSGMTESSGVFTFPTTGIYRVDCRWNVFCNSTSNRYVSVRTELSTDGGSNYAVIATSYTNLPNLGETLDHTTSDFVVDVTNTSNFKVRTVSSSSQAFTFAGNQWAGVNANSQTCSMTFMKIGDT
tara:strand:- start:1416 stop:2036 length:621 start_codon:yes stop_codon:yes gene_type:complete